MRTRTVLRRNVRAIQYSNATQSAISLGDLILCLARLGRTSSRITLTVSDFLTSRKGLRLITINGLNARAKDLTNVDRVNAMSNLLVNVRYRVTPSKAPRAYTMRKCCVLNLALRLACVRKRLLACDYINCNRTANLNDGITLDIRRLINLRVLNVNDLNILLRSIRDNRCLLLLIGLGVLLLRKLRRQ